MAVRPPPQRFATLAERSTYFGNALPGIVVALALVTVSLRLVPAVYQTMVMLFAAYAIMFLPRAMVSLRAAMAQAPPVLDDVAHALGAGPLATFRRVTLPLIAPGLGAGAALVFLAVDHRADRDAAARPDRHADPGHPVLEQQHAASPTAPLRPTPR